jgi:hypothetical protein
MNSQLAQGPIGEAITVDCVQLQFRDGGVRHVGGIDLLDKAPHACSHGSATFKQQPGHHRFSIVSVEALQRMPGHVALTRDQRPPVLRIPRRITFIPGQWQAAPFEQNDRVKTVGDGNQRHHTDLLEGYFYRAAHERLGRYGSGSSSGPLTTLETRIVLAESVRATLIRRRTALRRVHIQAGVIFTGTISASRHWGWIARLAPAPRRRVLGAAGRLTADGTQFGSI